VGLIGCTETKRYSMSETMIMFSLMERASHHFCITQKLHSQDQTFLLTSQVLLLYLEIKNKKELLYLIKGFA